MKILILLLSFNHSICSKIESSNIPEDCKSFYVALTILESGWYKKKSPIKKNNYSGFKEHGVLKTFISETEYVIYFEGWFIRKRIRCEKDFHKRILAGKYAILPKKELKAYLNTILKIKKKYEQFRKTA